ncbi:MAG TPA: hypothetical protein VFC83_00430 [Erysipelotrichaceae bacterium]|nr:hypothetical protein [Erysipelotrichaceae bacterium]
MFRLFIVMLTFPFRLLFEIAMFFITLIGKGLSLLLGIFLTLIGILISMTIVGLIIGLPIMMLGLSIILSALFG